ncbi:hypothetical protein [Cellulosilyticum sp. I15G10I2]|uniref:hypothetical protein n=1 Tax=Cellulosilyticum sp. I15G10I2 TaxID=1892843 RepID=UPI00085BE74D|nr:hypothetical protein [Cellulosilyticum sp. I15G10I2]
MRNAIKSKLSLLLLLSIMIYCFIYPPLFSSNTVTPAEHKNIITQYIASIRILHNQVFSLFENAISVPPEDSTLLESKITFIYRQIEQLDRNISSYLDTLPRLSTERRDTLITMDALHFLENSLYQLTEFIRATDSATRTQLLGDFYFLRTATADALNRVENIILRE